MNSQQRILSYYLIVFLISSFFISLPGCSKEDHAIIDELFEKGINSCQKGNFHEGIQLFNEIIKLEPDNYFAYLNRGIAYRNKNEYHSAMTDFNKCIHLDSTNPKAYFELGGVWSNQGKYREAIKYYTKAIDVDAKFTKAYGTRAIIKTMLGDVDSAIEDLNDAIKIDPQFTMLYIVRGQALDLKGNCQAAIEDFEKAMSLDTNCNANGNIAWVLATCPDDNSRNGQKALKLALKTIELEKGHFNLHAVAAAYAEIRDFKNAIIFQEKAINDLKENIPAHQFEREYREDQLKDYLSQLRSYKNNRPWNER